ncbi:MAG TPA: signal peptide peptidase SppA [Candidatus Acidoferrales bacterium]
MVEQRASLLRWMAVGGAALLAFVVVVLVLVFYSMRGVESDLALGGDKVAVVDVIGEIRDVSNIVEEIQKYGKEDSVRAIVIRLNTPGGSAAATQEVFSEIKRVREEKKKVVVASIASVGASGGYYIACATQQIFANPSSITGSIGAIAQWTNYGELLRWAKMKDVVIKSGAFKDAGNPARDLTPEERAYIQGVIEDIYGHFVNAVAEGRKMKVEEVRKLADGKVFTGTQALQNHLVDRLGNLPDAIREAAKLAGIKGEPRVVHPSRERRSLLDWLIGDKLPLPPVVRNSEAPVQFQYLWK